MTPQLAEQCIGLFYGYAYGSADMLLMGLGLFLLFVLARWLGDVFAESYLGVRWRAALRRQAREFRRRQFDARADRDNLS